MRLIWSLAIIAAAGGASYEILMVVKDYIASPLLTVYERKAQVKMNFPIIQICPSHFVNKTRAYVDAGMHPSIVDEYRRYFESPSETTFHHYGHQQLRKTNFDRLFENLPLAYVVVTSASKAEAMSRIAAILESKPMFAVYSAGEALEQMYKVGFYEAQRRSAELRCVRALLNTTDTESQPGPFQSLHQRRRNR